MNILEYNSVFYKIIKSDLSVKEFTKSMLHNCIKVVRLQPDQPKWLWACTHIATYILDNFEGKIFVGASKTR